MFRLGRWFGLTGAIAILMSGAAASVEAAETVKITAIVLSVQHRSGPSGDWATSKVGSQLPAGSRVRTGKRSKCEIKFPDGSIIRMGPRSDMVIQAVKGRDLQLEYGSLWAKFVTGSGARIKGGSAVAAIKGTTLSFRSNPNPDGTSTDDCTVYETKEGVQFETERGTIPLWGGFGSAFSAVRPKVPVATPQPPAQFAGGRYSPDWTGYESGANMRTTPGADAGLVNKQEQYASKRAVTLTLPGTYGEEEGPREGDLEVVVSQVPRRSSRSGSGALFAMAQAPEVASAIFETTIAQTTMPQDVFGKRFFGPYLHTDVFGIWGETESLAGLRIRPTAVVGDWYLELGGTSWGDLDGNWHTFMTEAFAATRSKGRELTIGRQHYLEGPVNNSDLGTIIGFDPIDAVRWRVPVCENWTMDVGYVQDYLPFSNQDLSGYFARAQTNVSGGMVGVNWVRENTIGSAYSFDVSFPLVKDVIDVYGEFGTDTAGRHVETVGFYLAHLYQHHDIDLFMERAQRSGEPTLTSVVAYKQLSDEFLGLVLVQKSSGDSARFSIGGMWEF